MAWNTGGAAPHAHPGTGVYVSGRGGGIFLHGWPVCNLNSCVIVMQQWEDLSLSKSRSGHSSSPEVGTLLALHQRSDGCSPPHGER
jgi:hypothetical protein